MNPERLDSKYIRCFGPDTPAHGTLALSELGGKGINLCRLTQAGFDVPPGYVVTTAAYHRFVETAGIADRIRQLAESLNPSDSAAVDRISGEIRALFTAGSIPAVLADEIRAAYSWLRGMGEDRVAVRSSATAEDLAEASFAGQQDTYLNIRGEEPLLKSVRSCWGSLWTARAMVYRARHDVPMAGLGLAVVVQRLAIADAAGIMFTANPLTGARNELVINAAWGLGEAIVGGEVTPDTIIFDKDGDRIKSVAVSDKTVMTVMTETGTEEVKITDERRKERALSDADAARVARLGKRIEEHYGAPQDCEWALAGGDLYLVQSRPITSLPVDPVLVEEVRRMEINRLKSLAGDRRRVWVLHNLDEILPAPTPLTWDIVRRFMSGNGGFGKMYRDMGYRPGKAVREEGFLELICGRIYADPERAADLFWDGMPLVYDTDQVANDPALLETAPQKFDPSRADGRFLLNLPRLVRNMLRCSRNMKRMAETTVERFENEIVPPFKQWAREKRRQDLAVLSTDGVIAELKERIRLGLNEIGSESLKPGFFGGSAQAALEGALTQLMGDEAGRNLALVLTQGLDGDSTIEQNIDIYRMARGEVSREQFLEKYGHRTALEMELARERWRENDDYLRNVVATYMDPNLKSPADMHRENAGKRKEKERELPGLLAEWGGSSMREDVLKNLADAQKMLPYREVGKDYLIMGYETIRLAVMELARRWNLGNDVFFLTMDELEKYEREKETLADTIEIRKKHWEACKRLDMAGVVDTDDIESLGLPRHYEAANELKGDPIASGMGTGPAMVIYDPSEAASDCTDYILVCPSTDPGWTALFVHAKGLIVEHGGVLSHGAIVARDFGIPAVVCNDATKRIPDRARVRVDGNRGLISILGEE